MSHKILIIDDEPEFSKKIVQLLKKLVPKMIGGGADVLAPIDDYESAKAAAMSDQNSYDLVILDVNLKDRRLRTGLDVLTYFKLYKSAWMVAILTGIESDDTADEHYGVEEALKLRTNLRSDAMKNFFPDRLTVIEKTGDQEKLESRIGQVLRLYEHIDAQRYVFRQISVGPLKYWQIRYGCSDMITIEDQAGFTTLSRFLKGETLTTIAAAIIEPDTKKGTPKRGKQERPLKPAGPVSAPTIDEILALVKQYAADRGMTTWDQGVYLATQKEIQRKLTKLGDLLLLKEDAMQLGKNLPPQEQAEIDALCDDLGPKLSALGASSANVARAALLSGRENENSIESAVIRDAARSGVITPKGKRTTAEKETIDRPIEVKAREDFSNRKRLYLKKLREIGLDAFAEHLDLMLKPKRGVGWTYKGGYRWITE